MGYKVTWNPVSESWTTAEFIQQLQRALSLCSPTDVILTATEGRDRFLPFTEYSALQCDNCDAICSQADQFLVHTLKCRFDEAHLMLYKRLGMIPRTVQRILDRKWERSSSMVGRALQNNQELCVMTPVESPLAPFMLSGVTVSTSEPKRKNVYVRTTVESRCIKSVPIYFCVRAVRRRFEQMEKHTRKKMAKQRLEHLKNSLKSFRIDVLDLLEFPPKDPEIAHLLQQATGLPIGTAIIPTRRIRLRVPIFSFSDLKPCSACISTVPLISKPLRGKAPTFKEDKPNIKNGENIMIKTSFVDTQEEKPPTLSSSQTFNNFDRRVLKRKRCF